MSNIDHAYAIILAGGGGTRLWPKSRNQTPKQFLRLTSQDSMMQVAANHVKTVVDWDHMIVVTNQDYVEEVKKQLPLVPVQNIIAEPQKKDTALAMLVGAMYAHSMDPEAVVINGASDHVVINEAEFTRVMKAAIEVAAEQKYLLAVGINPTFPSSAFGYIKIGEKLADLEGNLPLCKVDSFTEKPDEVKAAEFIATGKYYWNANMYVWSCEALIRAFREHQPEIYRLTQPLQNLKGEAFQAALPAIYEQATAISIDFAISEKVSNLALIPGDFGWNDVGDWRVVHELGQKDDAGNVIIADHNQPKLLVMNSQHNVIQTHDKLVALYGVNDMVIVDTPEILMIIPREKSQDVKKLVEQLKKDNKKEYL